MTHLLMYKLSLSNGTFDAILFSNKHAIANTYTLDKHVVYSLSVLVRKLSHGELLEIVSKLIMLVSDPSKHESTDIYAIGLKTIITNIHSNVGEAIATKAGENIIAAFNRVGKITPTSAINASYLNEIESSVMDILKELINRFGGILAPLHGDLLGVISSRISHTNDVVRKRAIACLGILVSYLNDSHFQLIMEQVISRMQHASVNDANQSTLYSYLQSIGVICQSGSNRVGKYLASIIPQLQRFCVANGETDDNVSDVKIELWENCMQAFESIIIRCSQQVTPYVPQIIDIAKQFMKYDPNYNYDADENKEKEEGEKMDAQSWGDENDGGDDNWGDEGDDNDNNALEIEEDDDTSWKVRRASVRCISAFVKTKSDMLGTYASSLSDELVDRFKERDINVKLVVFSTMSDLLRESIIPKRDHSPSSGSNSLDTLTLARTRSWYESIDNKVSSIMTASLIQLKQGKPDVQRAIISVIRDVISVRRGHIPGYLSQLLPLLYTCAATDDMRLKADSLSLLRYIVDFHAPNEVLEFIDAIAQCAIRATRDSYLKVTHQLQLVFG